MGLCFSSTSATIVTPVRNRHVYVRFTMFINVSWCGAPNGAKAYTLEEEPESVQCTSLSDAISKLRKRQTAELRYASIYNTRSEITYIFSRNALTADEVYRLTQLPQLNYVDITVENGDLAQAQLLLRQHPKLEVLVLNGVHLQCAASAPAAYNNAEINQFADRNTPGGTVSLHISV